MKRADAKPARGRAGTTRRRFLPPQHGAWAMLAVPYVAGAIAVGWRWLDLALLGAWIAGYLSSYYIFQAVKSRRPGRYRDQFMVYGGVAAPLAILVVVLRPAVLLYAPAYAVLFALNAWYAWRRQERAVVNDVASVVQSSLVVFLVATIAGAAPGEVSGVFVLCVAYFLGTVFYVKTMIRERENVAFRRWSIGYHVVAFGIALWLSPWAGLLFAWLLVRAALLPGRGLSPKQVGLVEIANSVVLVVCSALL